MEKSKIVCVCVRARMHAGVCVTEMTPGVLLKECPLNTQWPF